MRIALTLTGIMLLLMACDDRPVVECAQEITDGSWAQGNALECTFEMHDTVSLHDFYIDLRNGEEYPFSNIFLFVDLTFPNGMHSLDTVECMLADPQGNWYGSGVGSRYFNRIRWANKSRKAFPLTGEYHVRVEQAMRTPTLTGIYDVGFRLEPTK